jgi:hypothetical protein
VIRAATRAKYNKRIKTILYASSKQTESVIRAAARGKYNKRIKTV